MMAIEDRCGTIAIVGAGIAGLACARRLQQAGVSVEVIDKGRAPGGRVATRRGDDWQCDHGAQYFTARDPAFAEEAARWRSAGIVSPWAPRLAVFDPNGRHEASAGTERLVGTPRMSAIGRHLAAGLPLRLGTEVVGLENSGEAWDLITLTGKLRNYSGVVLALPAPQAGALLAGRSESLWSIASTVRMRGCWALMASYRSDPKLDFDAAFVNQGPLAWVARDSSKPARPPGHTWLLHAPADTSGGVDPDMDRAEVARILIRAFASLGAPTPDEHVVHRWRFADTPDCPRVGAQWDAAQRIGVAGDWLNGGRVEGAWLSGNELAARILGDPLRA